MGRGVDGVLVLTKCLLRHWKDPVDYGYLWMPGWARGGRRINTQCCALFLCIGFVAV